MSEAIDKGEVILESPRFARSDFWVRKLAGRYWGEALVIALAVVLWAPRLSGPIDLRWDGGVYYILGTSLSTGHGYRLLNEPGSPEALQYPPLLPAVVALYQRVLGSTDPVVIGSYLRISYAIIFVLYALGVFALAKRYLKPIWALGAAALCLLHFETIFLSDLLFAELPFALVTVLFALIASESQLTRWPWLREGASYALATIGFAFRTAGVALLGAWVLEAAFRRRWRLAIGRCAIALLPVIAWQVYVARVRASDEYAHPAYEYQRAPYQYYNVSYADNARLLDPFRPELGPMNTSAVAKRLANNLPNVLAAMGQGISTRQDEWRRIPNNLQHHLVGKSIIPSSVVLVPIFSLTALVITGLLFLVRRRAWLMVFIILGSVALAWATPWPVQFTRYLMPIACFLSICAFLALSWIADAVPNGDGRASTIVRTTVAGALVVMFGATIYTSVRIFRLRAMEEGIVVPQDQVSYRLFAHDRPWQDWEEAAAWIDAHAPRNAIIATSAPHWLYLRTGRRAVLPPMEADPVRARILLETVPVSFVIIESWEFLDMSRRYARPAVESDTMAWQMVQSFGNTKIYERQTSRQ